MKFKIGDKVRVKKTSPTGCLDMLCHECMPGIIIVKRLYDKTDKKDYSCELIKDKYAYCSFYERDLERIKITNWKKRMKK